MPDIETLERLTQSIAMLDAIISPEWEYRYFSFNAAWDSSKSERMASMRNGSGDEYFILFSPQGTILKGFDHEAVMSPWSQEPTKVWPGVLDHVPASFASFLTEPAFSMDNCTFCIWRESGSIAWHRGPITFPEEEADPDGSQNLLWMLDGDPATYKQFAADYFETTLNIDSVSSLYAHSPLTPTIVAELNSEASWDSAKEAAQEIGFPIAPEA